MTNAVLAEDELVKENFTRVEWVYRKIKKSILDNEYYPGFQALEPEIAKMLGVSRTPVREALIRLENERLIELIPRRGMRVVPLVPEDMKEIYQVLTSLEATAVELITLKRPTIEHLRPLATAIELMDASLDTNNKESWAQADDAFHKALLQLSGNRRLKIIAASLRDEGHRARLITLRLLDKPTETNDNHRALYQAILSGEVERAKAIHTNHRKKTNQALASLLEDYKLPHL